MQLCVGVQNHVKQSVLKGPACSLPYQLVHLASTAAMSASSFACHVALTAAFAFM